MESPSSLLLRNDLGELARLETWVSDWARQYGVAEQTAQHVDLCATETVTNIMTHGFEQAQAGRIELRLGCADHSVVLEIEDDGVAFDPTGSEQSDAPATLESTRIGGWGIRIVRRFAEQVSYRRSAGCNCLTLVFRQPPRDAP
jgi:anti-sigma regulatory factor (Ser/Thr protein kinase)